MSGIGRDLGPCKIYYGTTAAAATEIGESFGDVKWNYAQLVEDVKSNANGRTPVDGVNVGSNKVVVSVPLSRLTMAQLAAVVQGGSNSGGESGGVKVLNNKVGTAHYVNSKVLVLKPVVDGDADTVDANFMVFSHAYPISNFDVTYNDTGQRVYAVDFHCYPDASTKEVFRFGL